MNDEKMNDDEIELIRKVFKEDREIVEKLSDDETRVSEGIYQGGSVYRTIDDELIDLEIQTRDYDIEDHVNYMEFAEELYKKHEKRINVYVYCIPSVKINLQLYRMKSDADFKIRLAQVRENSVFTRVKSKIMKGHSLF